ncbi:MAG: hypothetical protein WBG08_06115 [Litorimonas sp.]
MRMWVLGLALFGAALSAPSVASASPQCKQVVIKSADAVRSSTVELYVIEDGNVVPAPGVSKLETKKMAFPVTLLDCNDSRHYFWRRSTGPVLVKKVKFLCVAIDPGPGRRDKVVDAGVPGSGSTNATCD